MVVVLLRWVMYHELMLTTKEYTCQVCTQINQSCNNNIYRGMKILITKNLYPKIGIVMEHLVMSKAFYSQNHIEFNMIT
jgi:hypothetical protein